MVGKQTRWRTAIDPLFRSAAGAYGTRVIGVVLTGMLDDGTAELLAIKRCGGSRSCRTPKRRRYPICRLPLSESAVNGAEIRSPVRVEAVPVELCRVLLVDDNLDNLESTAMSLRRLGHEVATAESGRRALELARAFCPNVMVIDIGMPDMDGFELATQIRDRDAGVGIIALSASGTKALVSVGAPPASTST